MTFVRRFVYLALIVPTLAMAASFGSIVSSLASFAAECFKHLAPGPSLALIGGDLDGPRRIDGVALARDVQQGVRHEAGVPRYGAPRNV